MNAEQPSRRGFLQLAAGLALTWRHGLLQAAPVAGGVPRATLRDAAICLDWDGEMRIRVSRVMAGRLETLSDFRPGEYLQREDGSHIAAFRLQHVSPPSAVTGIHGAGTRLVLSGLSSDGVEKTLTATLYERYPGFAVIRASYRNTAAHVLTVQGWTSCDLLLKAAGHPVPAFWSYSGATYENRRDWVQPVTAGFEQDNYLGMEAADYGGGTPVVDVWHPHTGLAVGHVEPRPALVSLPVQAQPHGVRVAVCSRRRCYVAAGATLETLDAFVALHTGDHFATLDTYRRVMADRGLIPASPKVGSYEADLVCMGLRARLHHRAHRRHPAQGEGTGSRLGRDRRWLAAHDRRLAARIRPSTRPARRI